MIEIISILRVEMYAIYENRETLVALECVLVCWSKDIYK